ncbi:transglutaminase family protein, partial [Vibrio parahaemolyticus]
RRPTAVDAEKIMFSLCEHLGLPADSGIPAFEDAAHFMLVEQKLPVGITPQTNKIEDPAERERLIKVFDRG